VRGRIRTRERRKIEKEIAGLLQQERQESFAAAGNTRGAQLLGEAADNVRAMKTAARASDAAAFASATATSEETTVTAEQREALDQLLENRRQLEANIEEAQRCCGLPQDFLDEELRAVDSDLESLRTQLGPEQDESEEVTTERRAKTERRSPPNRRPR
jgi:transposase